MSLKSFEFDSALAGQTVLIVENEIPERTRLGMNVLVSGSKTEAFRLIEEQAIDYAYCDLHLSTESGIDVPDGLEVIKKLKEGQPQSVIVAISSDPRLEMGDKALISGAEHFARKPFQSIEDFKIALRLASQRHILARKSIKHSVNDGSNIFKMYPEGIVISSELRKVLGKLAQRPDVQLNLAGETGTGKEEIAKIYHNLRSAIEGPIPFVAVNCAQLNSSIADSELFGHKKGSYTGANENTIGYIGEAHGGILFLDEIHTLEPLVQSKLLRVLNDGGYTRVGEARQRTAQFQLITASTRDLDEEALAGRFAMDLKMRIDGYPLFLPPLRERKKDIPDLLRMALARNQKTIANSKVIEVSSALEHFHWAGNIRQFFKVINAWVLHCDIYELPLEVAYIPVSQTMKGPETLSLTGKSKVEHPSDQNFPDMLSVLTKALQVDCPIDQVLSDIERAIIRAAVTRHRTLGDASNGLELTRSTFDARRRKYNMT